MQPAFHISSSGLRELEPPTKNSILVANEQTVLHTLRFISPGPALQIAVFATKPGDELKDICNQHNLLLLENKFSIEQTTGFERIIIVKDNLKSAVTVTGSGHKTWREVTRLLSENNQDEGKKWKRIATWLVISFALMIAGHLILSALPIPSFGEMVTRVKPYFNYQLLFFTVAGFAAQMVDGALGMGYGVTSATCLMSFGVNPVSVSAAIHTSEIFTTGISGYSHYKFGNVNKKLFRHLAIPGILGAFAGAILLVILGEKAGKWLMPVIAFYALFLGLKILLKAFQKIKPGSKVKRIGWLAGAGGFLDSFGGGGWGPIVTSTLISKGRSPKYTVGSVSLSEFFVTLASAATFFLTVGIQHWNIVLGLIIGGSIAAPIAARLAGKLPKKTMMIAVGTMIIIWCLRMILKTFFI